MSSTEAGRTAVAVMLRSPTPGRVSTRLVPPLTDVQAAGLYRAFLLDTFSRLRLFIASFVASKETEVVTLIAAYTPEEGAAGVGEIVGSGVELVEQKGSGLGERIENLFQSLFEAHFTTVIVIGSDSPDLPLKHIEEAVGLLRCAEEERARVVVGPATDGGYYLIGMNGPYPELFDSIPWSTSGVLEATLKRAASAGINVTLLDEWHDIDTPEDLILLKENSNAPESAQYAAKCGLFTR